MVNKISIAWLDFAEILKIPRASIMVSIIDPGKNCAIRTVRYDFGQSGLCSGRTLVSQRFFQTSLAGGGYEGAMKVLIKNISECPEILAADAYIIEEQFKSNVIVSMGVLFGAISALRVGQIVTRLKTSGTEAFEYTPFNFYTINARIKTQAINCIAMDFRMNFTAETDIKEIAIHCARALVAQSEPYTISLLDASKADDVADVVCYDYGMWRIFSGNPMPLPSSYKKDATSRRRK